MTKKWTSNNIPDQTGRTAVVTGANTGIGFATALELAKKGANVTLACRSRAKGEAATKRLLQECPNAEAQLSLLDLSDLESIEKFSETFLAEHQRLDLLVCNAGVMVPPASKTKQGFELQFGVNHLGHFALVGRLLPLLLSTKGSRVTVVSSTAAHWGKMSFQDLNFEKRGYSPWGAYGQSKLANQLFVRELQKRLADSGSATLVTAAHPGWTATELQRTHRMSNFLNRFFAMKPPQGALPTLRAATDPRASAADYFGPDGFMEMTGYPEPIKMTKRAYNDSEASELWQVSEQLTGVEYKLPA